MSHFIDKTILQDEQKKLIEYINTRELSLGEMKVVLNDTVDYLNTLAITEFGNRIKNLNFKHNQ